MRKRYEGKRLAIEPFESRHVLSATTVGLFATTELVEHPLTAEPHAIVAQAWVSEAGVVGAATAFNSAGAAQTLVVQGAFHGGVGLTPVDRHTELTTIDYLQPIDRAPRDAALVIESQVFGGVITTWEGGGTNYLSGFTPPVSFVATDFVWADFDRVGVLTRSRDLTDVTVDEATLRIAPIVAFDPEPAIAAALGAAAAAHADTSESLEGIDYAAAITSTATPDAETVTTLPATPVASVTTESTPLVAAPNTGIDARLSLLATDLVRSTETLTEESIEPLDDWFEALEVDAEPSSESADARSKTVEGFAAAPVTEPSGPDLRLERLAAIQLPAPANTENGGGVIDLAAMLLPPEAAPERDVAPVIATHAVPTELAARDAAFAVESWVRRVPQDTSRSSRAAVTISPVVAEKPVAPSRWTVPEGDRDPAETRGSSQQADRPDRNRGDQARSDSLAAPWIVALFGLTVAWGRWRRVSRDERHAVEPPRRDRGSKPVA